MECPTDRISTGCHLHAVVRALRVVVASPVHQLTAFRLLFPNVSLPKTEACGAREFTLPLYPSIPPAQVDTIVDSMVHSYTPI